MTPRPLLKSIVRLTACTPADLPTLLRWHHDVSFLRLYDARAAYPRSEAELAQWLADAGKPPESFLFGIRPPDDDELLGFVVLDGLLWSHANAWLTIAIGDPAHRDQGYGRAALSLALDWAFAELNLHRVQLTVFSYNAPAIALYERLGFQREGAHREFLQRDGQRHDLLLYGLLRHEWAARPPQP